MDYIFEDWKEKMSAFESSVEKDLSEIRQCKADIQEMRRQMHQEITGNYYVRDVNRIILSAPEIILGNVDEDGVLYSGASSRIIVRGTDVALQASGDGGRVETRAASIVQTAEDPGTDGNEHVLGTTSQVVSQARSIVIQSDDADEAFPAPATPIGCGVRIHADRQLDISATLAAENKEQLLEAQINMLESRKSHLKDQADDLKQSFTDLIDEIEDLLDQKEDLVDDDNAIRSKYTDVEELNMKVEHASEALAEETRTYSEILSMLSETNRLIKVLKDQKSAITKGDDFTQQSTGSSLSIVSERISLASADGDGNLRDNEGAGISMLANEVSVASIEADGQLKENGQVSITAKNIDVATVGTADAAYDDEGVLTTATYAAEGDFHLKSKNVTIEGVDYEVAESKFKEKQLTADSLIKLRAKTIEVSTEGSANVEVDDEGQLTKANYTAEGDIIVRSKTLTVESTDNDLENGEITEKALTADSRIAVRAEKFDLAATDTEGKATGSVNINAKAVAVKSMDVDKDSKADSALAADSTMVLVAEKMYVGAKSNDVKSNLVQTVSDTIGLFADTTLEAQQGDGGAVVQLDGGNLSISGSEIQIYGETTVNAATEIKGELKAPKATIDAVEAKSALKSPNISDGMSAGAGGGGGSLSAKLQVEDAPSE